MGFLIQKILPCLFILPAGILSSTPLRAQDNSLYFNRHVPQSIYTNPAILPVCKTYIELPVISSVAFSYQNNGFGHNDLFHPESKFNTDSVVWNFDRLEKKLGKINLIRMESWINLAGAGFSPGEFYVHFNVANRTLSTLGLPKGIIDLRDGNWDESGDQPRDISLSGLEVDVKNFHQFMLGASHELYEGFRIGARAKYLMGTTGFTTRGSDLNLFTTGDPINLEIENHYIINASFPMQIRYDSIGLVSSVDFSNSFDDPVGDFLLTKNHGFAMDFGVFYEYDDNWNFAASLIDLGFIRWREKVNNFESRGEFEFRGFDFVALVQDEQQTDLMELLVDSLSNSFTFSNTQEKYFSALSAKIFMGAQYQVNAYLDLAAVSRTELISGRFLPSLTLTATSDPVRWAGLSLSWSWMNNRADHLGLALRLGGPAVQFYFVSDHIPLQYVRDTHTGLIWPYYARTVNFRVGLNILFGCEEKERAGRPDGRSRCEKLCPAYW